MSVKHMNLQTLYFLASDTKPDLEPGVPARFIFHNI